MDREHKINSTSCTNRGNAGKSQPVTVQLTDMSGKVLKTQPYDLNSGVWDITIGISGIAKGVYVLSIQDNNGLIATRSVVVE